MTVTESAPATTERGSAGPTSATETDAGGLAAVLGSGDHKTVGRLYVVTSLVFLLVAVVAGGLLGIERVDTGSLGVLGSDVVAQVFTLHSVAAVFLFLLPLLVGLALVVVPLQVGASTIAFPRAAAASYWAFLVSGALVLAAYAIDGGPFGGDADGVDLFLAAMVALLVALLVAVTCIVTTVLTLRAPGMSLARVPLFSWSNLVAGVGWVLTLPVLAGVLVLVYLDNRYALGVLGGSEGVYRRISWVFGQPTVYLFAVPALGIIGDVVPVFARTRHQRHRVALLTIGAVGLLSLGAWAQPALAGSGGARPYTDEGPWLVYGFLTLAAVFVLLALWAGTVVAGKVKLGSPLLFAVAAAALLVLGAAAGALNVISNETIALQDSTWAVAQVHATQLAVVLALLGGLAYWSPKILGSDLPENPARLAATVALVGGVVLVIPDLVSGAVDQYRGLERVRLLEAVPDPGDVELVEAMNLVSALGGVVLVLGVVLFLGLLVAAGAGRTATSSEDPWEGHTLEWATASPPPVGNFSDVPEITSEAPLYDARHAAAAGSEEVS